jgi:hypothetical protein
MAEQVEQWRPIADYDMYEISNLGNVRKTYKNGKVKILKPSVTGKGYLHVCLYSNGNGKSFRVHRLVAMAFIEQVGGKLTVDHIDRDRSNNNVENLRFADMKEQCINRITYRTDIEETDPKLRKVIRTSINNKEYHNANREKINEYRRQKILCECGAYSTRCNMKRHRTSNLHLKAMNEN